MTTIHPLDRSVIAPGAGVALVTLFDDTGQLLVDETADLAARLVDHGAASIMVAGSTGEFWALSDDERLNLTAKVRARICDRIPVIAHVGGVDLQRSRQMATRMEAAGASAVIALPLGIDQSAIPDFYEQLNECTPLPVLAYFLPQAGLTLPLELLRHLPVAGIKDSSGDGERLVGEVLEYGIETYTGAPSLTGLAHDIGAAGALLGLANVVPQVAADAFAGDRDALRTLVGDLARSTTAFPAALKQMTAERWGTPAGTRRPSP